jgi:epoxide hydrolase-like predicted phosphatase
MYKAVGFDWGGVLVSSKPITEGIAAILGIPKRDLLKIYYQYNYLANVESMSYAELWTRVVTDLGHPDKVPQVLEYMAVQQTFKLDQRMIDLVDVLKQKGFKVGLLSNNTRENGDKMRAEGLDKHFDVFLISSEIGYQKPSKGAFNLLIESLDVLPQEMIYIDDSEGSLTLAGEIGYHPILFTGYEKLKQDLTKLGVL